MKDERPNIVLLMTDQHRGDCLGVEGHPALQTPHLDDLATRGARFRHAYTACPLCIPARRTLLTGAKPRSHGVVGGYDTWLNLPTLPELLSRAGYQTHLCGKLHLWPTRKLYGFDSADWSDGPYPGALGDYGRFLRREGILDADAYHAHGAMLNSWVSRPWHLPDRFHFTNWVTTCALEFLERRDPTVPFFLKVSYFDPHQPVTPPPFYFDRYMNMDLPEPFVGDWARIVDAPRRGTATRAFRGALEPLIMKQYRAGYYGSINHIDDQIGRILFRFWDPSANNDWNLGLNTIFIFVSDHGEMLGDHQHFKKRQPYEPSARVPLLMLFPESMSVSGGQVRDEVVELMDIMPTLLDAAGVEIPDTVDGRSVLPLLRGQETEWREYIHGECASFDRATATGGMQYVTNGQRKYIWYPVEGRELFFDLENDPHEMQNLIGNAAYGEEIQCWRSRLIHELQDRSEEFVREGQLVQLTAPTPAFLPEAFR
jgi:arylsulfatase